MTISWRKLCYEITFNNFALDGFRLKSSERYYTFKGEKLSLRMEMKDSLVKEIQCNPIKMVLKVDLYFSQNSTQCHRKWVLETQIKFSAWQFLSHWKCAEKIFQKQAQEMRRYAMFQWHFSWIMFLFFLHFCYIILCIYIFSAKRERQFLLVIMLKSRQWLINVFLR